MAQLSTLGHETHIFMNILLAALVGSGSGALLVLLLIVCGAAVAMRRQKK